MKKKSNTIDVKDLRIVIDPAPELIIEFMCDKGMTTDQEWIDRLTLRYHGLILDLGVCQVLKQGAYSSGNFPAGLAWRVRVFKCNIDNEFQIKMMGKMASALEIKN